MSNIFSFIYIDDLNDKSNKKNNITTVCKKFDDSFKSLLQISENKGIHLNLENEEIFNNFIKSNFIKKIPNIIAITNGKNLNKKELLKKFIELKKTLKNSKIININISDINFDKFEDQEIFNKFIDCESFEVNNSSINENILFSAFYPKTLKKISLSRVKIITNILLKIKPTKSYFKKINICESDISTETLIKFIKLNSQSIRKLHLTRLNNVDYKSKELIKQIKGIKNLDTLDIYYNSSNTNSNSYKDITKLYIEIIKTRKLKKLFINYLNFDGINKENISKSLKNLKNLESLSFYGNHFNEVIKNIESLQKLKCSFINYDFSNKENNLKPYFKNLKILKIDRLFNFKAVIEITPITPSLIKLEICIYNKHKNLEKHDIESIVNTLNKVIYKNIECRNE